MKEQIKELRVKCDGLAQLTKELKPIQDWKDGANGLFESFDNSKEIEKTVDSLYLGKAWLGKVMGELGDENPYGSGYKTKEDIVPTQDVSSVKEMLKEGIAFIQEKHEPINWETANHIEKVDCLRTEIESLVKEVIAIPTGINYVESGLNGEGIPKTKPFSREFAIARTNCYTHLCEARFWLGFEMERIKNEK